MASWVIFIASFTQYVVTIYLSGGPYIIGLFEIYPVFAVTQVLGLMSFLCFVVRRRTALADVVGSAAISVGANAVACLYWYYLFSYGNRRSLFPVGSSTLHLVVLFGAVGSVISFLMCGSILLDEAYTSAHHPSGRRGKCDDA